MSTDNIQIVLTAQDKASPAIQKVQGGLRDLSKQTKGLRGLTYGVKKFGASLDSLSGTQVGGIVADLTSVAIIAQPFEDAVVGGLSKIKSSSAVQKASAAAGDFMASGIGQGLANAAVVVAPAAALTFLPAIIGAIGDHLTGNDLTSKLSHIGQDSAETYLAGFSDSVQTQFGAVVQKSFDESVAGGATLQAAADAAEKAGLAWLKSFQTTVDPMATLAAHSLSEHADDAVAAASNLGSDMGKALAAKEIWDKSAQGITGDLATALQNNTSVIDTAMEKVQYAIEHPMELAAAEARIQGAIAAIQYKAGVADPSMKGIFDQQIAVLEAQWTLISGQAYDAGSHAAKVWANGYVSTWQGNHVNLPGFQGNNNPEGNPHGHPGHHASGGFVGAGETTWVGERGPEKVTFGRPAHISPAGSDSHGHAIVMDGRVVAQLMDQRFGRKQALAPGSAYTRG